MPVDQKRINGPENSFPYRIYSKLNSQTYAEKLNAIIESRDLRKNGRGFNVARSIFLKCGIISKSKGSAYIEMGETKVIVAVYDPREIPKQNQYSIHGEIFCDFKFSPFSIEKHRKSPQTDSEEKSLAQAIMRALQPAVCRHEFPNFQVDVFANVLQDGGSVLGAAITCAGLALADAGIPMFDIVTAATVGYVNGKFFLDPSKNEEELCNQGNGKDEHGVLMIARLSTHEQISEYYQTGVMSLETISEGTELLVKANRDYVDLITQLLVQKVNKCIKEAETEDEE